MIPVKLKPAPRDFETKVGLPGASWLEEKGYPRNGPVPRDKTSDLHPYWREVLHDLHDAYDGICAYSCTYLELVQGAHSVDHFVPKSRAVEMAYTWANYRLASKGMNTKKGESTDVLDPFEIADETFFINFVDGRIFPNPKLSREMFEKAAATIRRLRLDSAECRKLRVDHFEDYRVRGVPRECLKRRSPFVYLEIVRQGL
ncbi:MAG TPA: hypothetical protein PK156_49985 [Polyangium sp.]|nr:hypothetical protein [Polyangium sp.]